MKVFNLIQYNYIRIKITLKKKQKTNSNMVQMLKLKVNSLKKKQDVSKNTILFNKNQYTINFLFRQLHKAFNKKINYIFFIKINYSNLFINVTNNLNEQIDTISIGYLKFKSLDNITQKYTLLQVLKNLVKKTKIYKNIAIHFKSRNYMFNKLILNFLKNFYYIQLIKFYNYLPHNGCRPKKKRRK